MAMDEQHKSLKKLVSLCLLVSIATLGVVVYGTFYQNAEQKLVMEELQGNFVQWRQLVNQDVMMRNNNEFPEVYMPPGEEEPAMTGEINPPEVVRPIEEGEPVVANCPACPVCETCAVGANTQMSAYVLSNGGVSTCFSNDDIQMSATPSNTPSGDINAWNDKIERCVEACGDRDFCTRLYE